MQSDDQKPKLLISACLLGHPVRYDGNGKLLDNSLLKTWRDEGRLVVACPEMMAGFSAPRLPCEITGGRSGDDVLDGRASIVDSHGKTETAAFIKGAELTLKMAQDNNCHFALLTENSPSCGSNFIYDGSFTGRKKTGMGVVTALLIKHGIQVFSETEISSLAKVI
ncbi:MAG: DUF523 domain-containing protein [Pseudomonas marincola]